MKWWLLFLFICLSLYYAIPKELRNYSILSNILSVPMLVGKMILNILKIDRELILGTVRRVAVCANKASNHIKFEFKPGQLEITAQDLGFATEAYEKIECDYSGTDLVIGFKSSFLIEILSNMSCETVVMKFADARRAALIVPSEEESERERICGILMPIMVS